MNVKDYLNGKKEFIHFLEEKDLINKKIYIKSPSEAPEGTNVQRGKKGGLFVEIPKVNDGVQKP